jgi:ubiquitin carboxyl-terminal hydrolase 7
MNAMVQFIFDLPAFRRIAHKMLTAGDEDITTSIPLNLQRLSCQMQLRWTSCSTKALTMSFGWDSHHTLVQHGTQEFCRMKLPTFSAAGTGHPIRCEAVAYRSDKLDDFSDLTLALKNCPRLEDPLRSTGSAARVRAGSRARWLASSSFPFRGC